MSTGIYRIDKDLNFIDGDEYSSFYIDFIKKKIMNYPSEKLAKKNGVRFESVSIRKGLSTMNETQQKNYKGEEIYLLLYFLIYINEGNDTNETNLMFFMKRHKHKYETSQKNKYGVNGTLAKRINATNDLISDFIDAQYNISNYENIYSREYIVYMDNGCRFDATGYYVDENGVKSDEKPFIKEPIIKGVTDEQETIVLDAEEKLFLSQIKNASDEDIIESLLQIKKDRNSYARLAGFDAIKNNKSKYLIREIIALMDNNAEKYNFVESLADNGYIDSHFFMNVVYAIDNSLYLYRVIVLLLSYNHRTFIEEIFGRIRNNNYIAYSLEAIYEVDRELCKKLYDDGKCFRPSPQNRIAMLLNGED